MDTSQVPAELVSRAVQRLATLRAEWQAACEGLSLLEVECSVGYMLNDVVIAIGLSTQDSEAVLGTELLHELDDVCSRADGCPEPFPVSTAAELPTIA